MLHHYAKVTLNYSTLNIFEQKNENKEKQKIERNLNKKVRYYGIYSQHLCSLCLAWSLDHKETEIICTFVHQSLWYLCRTFDKHVL
jgi:hypothetical protein